MEKQICTKCLVEKEINTENFESQAPGQYNKECRVCRNEYLKQWRDSKIQEDPFYAHKKALRELYKTTKEWYDAKFEEQGGHCALCEATAQSVGGKSLSVDHDHKCCPTKRACGECNRGLLCFNCNKRLGFLEQTLSDAMVFPYLVRAASWTARALQYLNKYQTQETQ